MPGDGFLMNGEAQMYGQANGSGHFAGAGLGREMSNQWEQDRNKTPSGHAHNHGQARSGQHPANPMNEKHKEKDRDRDKDGPRISCLACRERKVRCGGDGAHRCPGCVKRDLQCVYAARMPRQPRQRRVGTASGTDGASAHAGSAVSSNNSASSSAPTPSSVVSPGGPGSVGALSPLTLVYGSSGSPSVGAANSTSLAAQQSYAPPGGPPGFPYVAQVPLGGPLPFPEEDLPQLTPEGFNFFTSAFARLPQHPRPATSQVLRQLCSHPLVVACHLWAGALFAMDDSFALVAKLDPSPEMALVSSYPSSSKGMARMGHITMRLGRLVRRLLSIEMPRLLDELSWSEGQTGVGTAWPMSLDNLAVLLVLTLLPRILMKIGQPAAGKALLDVGLDMIRRLGPQLAFVLSVQGEPDDPQTINSLQLAEYMLQQQWIRTAWSVMGVEMGRTGIQFKSKLTMSPLSVPDLHIPIADHLIMRAAPLHHPLRELTGGYVDVQGITYLLQDASMFSRQTQMDQQHGPMVIPAPVPSTSAPTFGEMLGPLISDTPHAAAMRREVLAKNVTLLNAAGPTPLRLCAIYMMAMVSEFNLWLEKEANLTMLEVIVAEELFAREQVNAQAGQPIPSEIVAMQRSPSILEALSRRRALLAAYQALDEALPLEVKALDDAGDFLGIIGYAERNWSPAVVHGSLGLFESLIWLHTGNILLRCPEPFSDREMTTTSDPAWSFWLGSSTFAAASSHAIVVARYANSCLQLMQSARQKAADGLLGTVPLTSPLLPYALVYAGWFHIVTLNFLKRQGVANAGDAGDAANIMSELEKDARFCIGLLAANGWKQVDSHCKALMRMTMLAGAGPSEEERAELLLEKEVMPPTPGDVVEEGPVSAWRVEQVVA